MKTFIVLFAIAASLPAEAQRVKENIRQKSVILNSSELQERPLNSEVMVKSKKLDASRKR